MTDVPCPSNSTAIACSRRAGIVVEPPKSLGGYRSAPRLQMERSPPAEDLSDDRQQSPRFLTIAECADVLSVSAKTIRRRIKEGRLTPAPLGGRLLRIPLAEILRLAGLGPPEDAE